VATAQNLRVLDYLRAYLVANHRLPAEAAIARAFGWASPNAANLHMLALHRSGHLTTGEDGHPMLAHERVHLLPADAPHPDDALHALVRALLDPEDLGYAVPLEVRARARQALGYAVPDMALVIPPARAS
jgi:hypothetical protein